MSLKGVVCVNISIIILHLAAVMFMQITGGETTGVEVAVMAILTGAAISGMAATVIWYKP